MIARRLGLAAGVAVAVAGVLFALDYGFPDVTALIGMGLAALSIAAGKPRAGEGERCTKPRWLLPASVCAAVVPLLPILSHPGIPAMQHDWRWPLDAADVRGWWPHLLTAWDDSGWGGRTTLPGLAPAVGALSLAAYVLSAKGTLVALLLSALAAGAYGAGIAACRLVREPAVALVAVAAYAANPVVINKLGAGHTLFFVAYATVPWLFLVMSGSSPPLRRAALGGMLVGLGTVQPQFIAYDALVCAAGAAAGSGKNRAWAAVGAVALGLAMSIPMLATSAGGPPIDFRSPTTPWEISLSSTPAQAVGWDGYFGKYFLSQGGRFAVLPFELLSALGLGAAWRFATTRALAVLMLAGFVIVVGFAGPWEGAFQWMFLSVPAAAAFRELYHAAPLIAFPGSILGAFAINRSRYPVGVALAAAGIVLTAAGIAGPWRLPAYRGESVVREVRGSVDPRGAGIASLPLTHPVGVPPTYGLDPSAWSEPGVPAYWTYEPTQPALAVGTAFACGGSNLASLLERTDVGFALLHAAWRGGATVAPSIPLETPAACLRSSSGGSIASTKRWLTASGDVVDEFAPTSNGGWIDGRLATTARIDGGCGSELPADFTDASIAAERLAVDAGADWVPARPYYLEHPEIAYAPAVGVYTRSTRSLTLPIGPGPIWLLVWSGGAAAGDGAGREVSFATGRSVAWRRVNAKDSVTIRPTAPTAIFGWSAAAPTGNAGHPCAERPLRWMRSKSTEWSAELPRHGPGTVIFRQRFDSGWTLRVNDTPVHEHVVVDGYANGWHVPAGGPVLATAIYAPQSRLNALLAVSGLAWLLCVGMCFVRSGRNAVSVATDIEERHR